MKSWAIISFFLLLGGAGYVYLGQNYQASLQSTADQNRTVSIAQDFLEDPLTIKAMAAKSYPGSSLVIETTLPPKNKYDRFIVSYKSDGLTQYGLLTVPIGQKPPTGWPVILFNHGYIPPAQYSTENSYALFVDKLASSGFIVFKPDYRGNAQSEGTPTQPYISPVYITDSLNALASIKQYKDVDPQKIGVFGHSMGGNITLHELVVTNDIKAAEIMSGVVGNETDIINWWLHRIQTKSISGNDLDSSYLVEKMISTYGTPESNLTYWNTIDPTQYVTNISAPVQIQVGAADPLVPPQFSASLYYELQSAGKTVDFHSYPGADHNLSPDTDTALSRTVEFFTTYLK